MRKVSVITLLSIVCPGLSMGYTPTVSDTDIRDHSYSVEQITQSAYNTAISQNANAPVIQTFENGETKYYKWVAPDLTLYKTATNADVFVSTSQGEDPFDFLVLDAVGNVSVQHYYPVNFNMSSTNNRMVNSANDTTPISSDFISNVGANMGGTDLTLPSGGAIYNTGTLGSVSGNFIFNRSVQIGSGTVEGGAIANYGTINTITGSFIRNYTDGALGGAVCNNNGNITSIDADFVGNFSSHYGGALFNSGHIRSINGNFINNYISGSGSNRKGGAIYNQAGGDYQSGYIDSINGDFINNSAVNGGAIYNSTGFITSVTGDFVGNTATYGGAIYNGMTIDNLSGIFNGNKAYMDTGGAIYNLSYIGMRDNVRFETTSDTIYNSGTIVATGTVNNPTNLYLQSVSGTGSLYLNGNTNAWLADGQSFSQHYLSISTNSILHLSTTSDFNVDTVINNGLISLTNGTLEQNISYYGHGGSVGISGSISGSAHKIDMAIVNTGTLTLTRGTLSGQVSGSGNIVVDGDVTSKANMAQNIIINPTKSLTVSANYITSANVTNNGLLQLSAGTLTNTVSGSGSIVIDGTVTSNINMVQPTIINPSKNLYVSVDNIKDTDLVNNGRLWFISGTLDKALSNYGDTGVSGFSGTLLANANYIDHDILNSGTLTLFDGIVTGNIDGSGTTVVNGNVTASANHLKQTTRIDSGNLTITGGSLNYNIVGGTAINTGVLRTVATRIQNEQFINNGTLNLYGGTLGKDITGNGTIKLEDVNLASNHVQIQNSSTIIDGTLQLSITNLSEGSTSYTGGKLDVIGDLYINPNAELQLVIAPSLLAEHKATGALDLISVSGSRNGDFDQLYANNMYLITKSGDKYIISLGSTINDIVQPVSNNQNFVNAGNAWNDAVFANNTVKYDMQSALNYLLQYDAEGYVEALDNVVPTEVNVADTSFRNINTGIIKQFSERFSNLKAEGRSGGDSVQAKFNIWAQALFNKSEQTGKSKFDADASGITFGAETIFDDKFMLALGYTYGKSDAKSGAKELDGNTTIFSLFAEYDIDDLYLNGGISYGMASYEQTTKYENTANFDANTLSLNGGIGHKFGNFKPEFRAIYTNTSVDKYKDAIGQEIQYDDNSVLSLVTSVKYSDSFNTQSAILKPEIGFGVIYDVISDDSVAKVDLGTAQYYVYGEKINPFGLNFTIGTGLDVGNWNFALGYDLEWRNNFVSHTGKARAKYMF